MKTPSVTLKQRSSPEEMKDQAVYHNFTFTVSEILASGGCQDATTTYENGKEWHPIIGSLGVQKCIKCSCKVSTLRQDRHEEMIFAGIFEDVK